MPADAPVIATTRPERVSIDSNGNLRTLSSAFSSVACTHMDPLPLLRDLVAANSVNPSLVPGAPGEAEAAEVARAAMAGAGLDVVLQEAAPGRPNVIGVLEGRAPGPSLMFCGHLDTVGVEGMTNPFVPRVEQRPAVRARIAGHERRRRRDDCGRRGARSNWTRGRLIVAAVVDEEYESLGAEALVGLARRRRDRHRADGSRPGDRPQGIRVARDRDARRAAHGSRPEDGRDAIARMGRVLIALEGRDRELRAQPPVPFQGTGSLHASLISGGRELSSYPDRCTLEMERRTVAAKTATRSLREVDDDPRAAQARRSGIPRGRAARDLPARVSPRLPSIR